MSQRSVGCRKHLRLAVKAWLATLVIIFVAPGVLCENVLSNQNNNDLANMTVDSKPSAADLFGPTSPTVQKPSRVITGESRKRERYNTGQRSRNGSKNLSSQRQQHSTQMIEQQVPKATTRDSEEALLIEQQQQMRRYLGYNNTPPLFVTNTRDFFIDVVRFPPGSKLTTIQAIDAEGDRIEYSLQASNKPDAMPYFNINPTTGELRLSQKRFPPIVGGEGGDHQQTSSIEKDGDNDDDYSEGYSNFSESTSSEDLSTTASSAASVINDDDNNNSMSDSTNPASNWIRNLYFLNVGANDGQHTNVLELQIHVINSSAVLPVQLTPENGRRAGEEIERLIKTKALEYYKIQNGITPLSDNSSILYPSYFNPSIVKPVEQLPREAQPMNNNTPATTTTSGKTTKSGVSSTADKSQNTPITVPSDSKQTTTKEDMFRMDQINSQTKDRSRDTEQLYQSYRQSVPMPPSSTHIAGESAPSLLASQGAIGANGNVAQPMVVHMVIVCLSCLLITLVLVMFTVPLYIKRLRKGLKHIELQHEHLSQHPSSSSSTSSHLGSGSGADSSCVAGLSTVCSASSAGSVTTTSGRHHLPSSLSQFTLNGSDRSCPMMMMTGVNNMNICNQHSNGCVHQHQLNYHHHLMQHPNNHDHQQNNNFEGNHTMARNTTICRQSSQDSATTNSATRNPNMVAGVPSVAQAKPIFNRINNGSIANPVYLHQHSQRFFGQEAVALLSSGPMNLNQYVDDTKMPLSTEHPVTIDNNNDIYYPIDDEFYSTINTDSTTIPNDINNLQQQQPQSNESSRIFCSTVIGSAQPHNLKRSNDIKNIFDADHNAPSVAINRTNNQPQSIFKRGSESPANSVGSRSSTRSLADFLSLPTKHRSHRHQHQQEQSKKSFVNELNQQLGDSFGKLQQSQIDRSGDQEEATFALLPPPPVAKTIARTAQVHREQQVRGSKIRDHRYWEVERHRLKFLDILDEGQFGLVWRCILKVAQSQETTVAVKTLKKSAARDEREREDLLAEIEIMKLACSHPNVVKILHCCTMDVVDHSTSVPLTQSKPILLVMEYVELGKLQSFLLKSRTNHHYATTAQAKSSLYDNLNESTSITYSANEDQHLTSRDLVKFIYHVAKGMEYISSKCIVHRDLATRNILVSSERICKIGDFGMARHMQSVGGVYERHSKNSKIPVRWMAPEVLLNNKFTTKSDVFSFGITMWEIVTLGSTPYRHLKTEKVIEAVARQGERPKRPEYCHEQLYEIMSRCWSHDPNERPTFSRLVTQLDELLMSANDYIQLDQYSDHNYCNIPQNAAPLELL